MISFITQRAYTLLSQAQSIVAKIIGHSDGCSLVIGHGIWINFDNQKHISVTYYMIIQSR